MGVGAGLGIGGIGSSNTGTGMSPSSNLMNFASPAGLAGLAGLDIGTPSLLDAVGAEGSTGMGGTAMNITLSDLGLSSNQGRRNEDEERRGKLEGVLGKLLGKRKRGSGMGRVSDEGIRRVGRWAGFDVEVEAKWEGKEFEGERPIIVAGRNAVLIDVRTVVIAVERTERADKTIATLQEQSRAKH